MFISLEQSFNGTRIIHDSDKIGIVAIYIDQKRTIVFQSDNIIYSFAHRRGPVFVAIQGNFPMEGDKPLELRSVSPDNGELYVKLTDGKGPGDWYGYQSEEEGRRHNEESIDSIFIGREHLILYRGLETIVEKTFDAGDGETYVRVKEENLKSEERYGN